ncbi:MAG TPA: NAD(P)-dependent oxidoreductase [Patescibacteria group bacterium]|nr:NAD(P)-dependent oxidoreductase [Patescibacteria group bacterium]
MSPEGLLPNDDQMKLLRKHGSVEIITHTGKLSDLNQLKQDTSEKVLGVDPDAFSWDMDGESVKNIPHVKVVCTQSTSFDWVKPQVLKDIGVLVANCPGFSADSVAEHAMGMAIDVGRNLPLYIKNGWKIDWKTRKPMLLKGKTLGVVGLGRIGTRICEIGAGIGMNVIYWSRTTKDKRFTYHKLGDVFQTADVIIPALVENEDTKKLLTHTLLDSVKSSSILVGINRVKDLWDEDYILKKVKNEEIAGYAFEGDNAKDPTAYEGNVLPLPAMAWYTQDSLQNLLDIWVQNMVSATGSKPQNIVNKL